MESNQIRVDISFVASQKTKWRMFHTDEHGILQVLYYFPSLEETEQSGHGQGCPDWSSDCRM